MSPVTYDSAITMTMNHHLLSVNLTRNSFYNSHGLFLITTSSARTFVKLPIVVCT